MKVPTFKDSKFPKAKVPLLIREGASWDPTVHCTLYTTLNTTQLLSYILANTVYALFNIVKVEHIPVC